MIFSLSKAGSQHVSYLMGTMHSRDIRAYTYYDRALVLMSQCVQFSPEMAVHETDEVKLHEAFTLPETLHLNQIWNTRKYHRFRLMLQKSFGLDLNILSSISPVLIQGQMMAICLGKEHNHTLDQALIDEALRMGLTIKGVESPEEQYAIASNLDAIEQARIFANVLRRPDKFRAQAHRLCELYAAGQLTALYQLGKRSLGGFRHQLLYDRNQVMSVRIAENHLKGPVFTAIGAAHLPGAKGVLRSLKKEGFDIQCVV